MLADELDYVVGVDTHRDQHTLAVVSAPSGGVVAERSVRASARGYAQAVRFAEEHAPGVRVWAIEGSGHYGAGLVRHLIRQCETVIESGRGPRDERRLRGKDDPLDAVRAARAALASEKLVLPRMGQRPRGFAAAVGRAPGRGRGAAAGARAATQRDRDRAG
jgi:hypothetical protein